MKKMRERDKTALALIVAAGSTWSDTMTEAYYESALRLEEQGMVRFVRRRVGNGHDVKATSLGLQVSRDGSSE